MLRVYNLRNNVVVNSNQGNLSLNSCFIQIVTHKQARFDEKNPPISSRDRSRVKENDVYHIFDKNC